MEHVWLADFTHHPAINLDVTTAQTIHDSCTNPTLQMVPVRRWIPDSVSWARLEDAGQLPLGRLLDLADSSARDEHASYDSGNNSGGGYVDHHELETDKDKGGRSTEPLYLHDWSVPQNLGTNCSLLAGSFKVMISTLHCQYRASLQVVVIGPTLFL